MTLWHHGESLKSLGVDIVDNFKKRLSYIFLIDEAAQSMWRNFTMVVGLLGTFIEWWKDECGEKLMSFYKATPKLFCGIYG